MPKLRKLVLLLLMLILPLQGLASVVAPMATGNAVDSQSASSMPCHETHAAGHAGQPAGDEYSGDNVNHMCCQQVISGATFEALNAGARKFGNVSRHVLPLYTLFIPDSPDRPPRG